MGLSIHGTDKPTVHVQSLPSHPLVARYAVVARAGARAAVARVAVARAEARAAVRSVVARAAARAAVRAAVRALEARALARALAARATVGRAVEWQAEGLWVVVATVLVPIAWQHILHTHALKTYDKKYKNAHWWGCPGARYVCRAIHGLAL